LRIGIDSAARRSYDPLMPFWRCPHCATPQEESARCWLCGRSTTSCAACRHYRRGVAGGLGLCGRDPRRLALHGTEVRPCWEPTRVAASVAPVRPEVGEVAVATMRLRGGTDDTRQPRTFVPVDELNRPAADGTAGDRARAVAASSGRPEPAPERWSLWGDPEA
jgi:hypothetical protein